LWTGAVVYFVESNIENGGSSPCRSSFSRLLGLGSAPIHCNMDVTFDKLWGCIPAVTSIGLLSDPPVPKLAGW